ncbi:DUF86 domain-containing protein [Candidatus Uhrbacteria bacterium]|nr:DUF86 domain-containing protein [Candidatus Uhrbacteria bacterium]
MLNKDFINRKIKMIQEDLIDLEKLAAKTQSQVIKNSLAYGAAERYLEKIITRAIDINQHLLAEMGNGKEKVRTYQDTFLKLSDLNVYPAKFGAAIAPSAGLRNILVHEYDEVDPKKIYNSLGEAVEQYARYCEHILSFISK